MTPDFPQLGPALQHLCRQARTLVDAVDITPFPLIPQNATRRTFRLNFEDGTVLKGRQFPAAFMATANQLIRDALQSPFLPRIIARHENALLEEWIPGTPVKTLDLAGLHICGQHLRAIHDAPVPTSRAIPFWDILAWVGRTRQSLTVLRDAGKLSPAATSALERTLDAKAPPTAPVAINLHDLCPDNLVLDPEHRLRCIDAGSIMLSLPEQDLARIWLRWPMTDDQRRAFAEGYGQPCASLHPPSLFWRIVLFANTARFRLLNDGVDVHEGVARLMEIARQEAIA